MHFIGTRAGVRETPKFLSKREVAGIGARERKAGDAQGRTAGIIQCYGLGRAGDIYGLVAESKAGCREVGRRVSYTGP